MNRTTYSFMITCVLLVIVTTGVADLTTIRPGGTVFLGEEELDITASGIMDGDQIGWWAPGSMISSEPSDVVTVSSPDSFYVSPSTFAGKEGQWYTWPGKNSVFLVKKPQISIRVYDESSDFDATGKWIPRGDTVSFKISSNVYEANSRGGSDGQIDIVLISPEGAKYSSVSGPSGSFSLEGIPLTSSLTSTGPVWSTGGEDAGTWTVRGEISMNRIKDNLPDVGEGISENEEVLIQNVNPLIKSDVSIQIGDQSTSQVTSVPQTTMVTMIPTQIKTKMITPVMTTLPPVQKDIIKPTQIAPSITNTPEQTTTPVKTNIQTLPVTPEPTPTKSSAGFLPVLGGVFFIFLIRRF